MQKILLKFNSMWEVLVNWKKMGIAILFPPTWIKLIIAMLAMASIVILSADITDLTKIIFCVITIIYCLILFATTSIVQVKDKHKRVTTQLHKNKYTHKYLTNIFTKTKVDLYIAVVSNILFIVFNFVSAVLYKSNWFGLFAIYYTLIGLIRFLILMHIN